MTSSDLSLFRWANVPEEAKKALAAETYQDGGFWMAYGDFLKYFKVRSQNDTSGG